MKRLFVFFFFLVLVSCDKYTEDTKVLTEAPLSPDASIHRISMRDAEENVLSFLKDMPLNTKSHDRAIISSKFQKGGFGFATKNASDAESPLVYIFNFADNGGYAIASGDDRMPQILCLTDSGTLEEDGELTNPAMIMLLSLIDTEYRIKVGLPIVDGNGEILESDDYATMLEKQIPETKVNGVAYYNQTNWVYYDKEAFGTIIPCEWGQKAFFNAKCETSSGERARAGCAAIAIAQIMYHWGFNSTYKGIYYDWNLMRKIENRLTVPYYISNSLELVQSLIAALGEPDNLDATYGVEETKAPIKNIPRTFRNFGYACGGNTVDYSLSGLKFALKEGPVLGSGSSHKIVSEKEILGIKISSSVKYDNNHTWVYDQYIERGCMRFGYNGSNKIIYAESLKESLVHCNFGCDGDGNGYYYSGDYNTKRPITRGSTKTVTGVDDYFRYDLKMTTGINPYSE